jgi:transposase
MTTDDYSSGVDPACGLVMDRDENAARYILWAGQALRGVVA